MVFHRCTQSSERFASKRRFADLVVAPVDAEIYPRETLFPVQDSEVSALVVREVPPISQLCSARPRLAMTMCEFTVLIRRRPRTQSCTPRLAPMAPASTILRLF